ncbi:DNA topoisomerase III, partial [Paenibacillus sepulcri]|nr:DNA topoisomerase III [Paenibacillus sepulcri]
ATIERLKYVGYIVTAGKRLDITTKGCAAIELIRGAGVELLASPEMTGRWEQRLHQISKGEASDEQFMQKVKEFAEMIVGKVRHQPQAASSLFGDAEGSSGGTKGKGRTPKRYAFSGKPASAAAEGSARAAASRTRQSVAKTASK